jgi:hypothetical protein
MSTSEERKDSAGNDIGTPVNVWLWKALALVFAGLAVFFLGTTVYVWLVTPGGDYDIKMVQVLIAAFGTLLTVLVSVIGLMLKDSMDRRTLDLRKQAEARLRMDTSLTAVGLMGAKGKEEGKSLQQAGALMALVNLGHEAFALGLLDELWRAESVPNTSAVWLIERCLLSQKRDLQEEAAQLLRKHADRLLSPEGRFLWPRGAFDERRIKSLSALAAFWSLEALLSCLTSRSRDQWDWEYLNEAYVLLDLFQAHENTRHSAAHAMKTLMDYFLTCAPADSPSRTSYEESLKEAQEILGGSPSSDSDAGRMPFLLEKLRRQLRS